MANSIEIDDSKIRKMFAELDPKRRKQAFRRTISSSLNIVKKQAVSNLKTAVNPSTINRKDQYGNSFKKGIKVKVNKDCESGLIHILGNYKLKWFELGTKPRFNFKKSSDSWSKHVFKGGRYEYRKIKGTQLRKRRYTGSIKAYHFFKNAKDSTEQKVFQNIDKRISDMIIKINRKYGHGN